MGTKWSLIWKRLRISQITRIVTVPLAFLQALGQSAIFVRVGVLDANTLLLGFSVISKHHG